MIVRRSPAVAVPLVYYQELLVKGMPFEVPVADVEHCVISISGEAAPGHMGV